jgi:transposase
VALVGLRSHGLRTIQADDATVALRLLIDRREQLGVTRVQVINRIHRLLLELLPGGAKKHLSAAQAKALLGKVRPRDIAGKTRRRLAAELIVDLTALEAKIKAADKELHQLITTTGSTLRELHGIGPANAARLLGDVGDITRFADKGRFASWNGTAPLDASSGDQHRHRLSRAGNRRINRVLHIMAVVQLRTDTKGRRYYDRKVAAGKTKMEAMRCLKRRLSDIVYKQMRDDAQQVVTGPGGQVGAATGSSAVNSNPDVDASEKSCPGPVTTNATPVKSPRPDRSSARSRRPKTAPARSRRQAQSA